MSKSPIEVFEYVEPEGPSECRTYFMIERDLGFMQAIELLTQPVDDGSTERSQLIVRYEQGKRGKEILLAFTNSEFCMGFVDNTDRTYISFRCSREDLDEYLEISRQRLKNSPYVYPRFEDVADIIAESGGASRFGGRKEMLRQLNWFYDGKPRLRNPGK